MKRVFAISQITFILALFSASALAKPPTGFKGNGAPKGKFEKFSLIAPGNPNTDPNDYDGWMGGNADSSGGKAIFIPLNTKNGPDLVECSSWDGTSEIWGDLSGTNVYYEGGYNYTIKGVKLKFIKGPGAFEIVDRDATDGEAVIKVPESWADVSAIELYIRVLGKPGGCIQADAYTFDGNYYLFAGAAAFKRKAGQSTFVDASELTDVWYCELGSAPAVAAGTGNYSCECTTEGIANPESSCFGKEVGDPAAYDELNVFADVFLEYFWDIMNSGVRNVQVLIRAL